MILHIPHSSPVIPENFRDQIVLSDEDLLAELLLMTDWHTDELFVYPDASIVQFPISRLLVDVERFSDDAAEPMSRVGMGVIYTSTSHGKQLKRELQLQEREIIVSRYYEPHHRELHETVKKELETWGNALIVDCHSFPSSPLPCDADRSTPRSDFCIGSDAFHTPDSLVQLAEQTLMKLGHVPTLNRPYSGSIVPIAYYKKNLRVSSIMIEINRSLYMDEIKGVKRSEFVLIKKQIGALLSSFSKFQIRCGKE